MIGLVINAYRMYICVRKKNCNSEVGIFYSPQIVVTLMATRTDNLNLLTRAQASRVM